MKELPKSYDPRSVEDRIYRMWNDSGCFRGKIDRSKKPFTIVIPPPNVTAALHIGHACDNTIQDILIRFRRMQGYCALWIPGTDHAGIATQIKVEEKLRNEGLTRTDLGREKFLEAVWAWKNEYGGRIINQLKKLGSSCDWSRERFTMDEGCSKAVRTVFYNMYRKRLIYKGNRIVNWCPDCVTALSDIEVEHDDRDGSLWYIRYPIKDSDDYITVATTRPETMLGDTGVAVNPEDERYRHLIGKTAILPLVGREIPIIADEYVDSSFGTGCVKMTPAHDPNDFEVGMRHSLEQICVLDEHGIINGNGGVYRGLDRYEARKRICDDLEQLGYLVKTEKYSHNVGACYRCGSDVEPMISDQWFVKMNPLAAKGINAVNEGEIKFVPDRFKKIYINWMENVHDWCISRQLWWGHQIPAWYCLDCGHVNVAVEDPACCENCGSGNLKQDEDVLDTWFSSALWPFSTLGWPENTEDLSFFYPTDVLVTAYDIIFFWVARMIFSGLEHTGEAPFHTVFIHGLVRDEKGRKMSKSLGNGVDPLEMIERYGADALRLNLITGVSPGNDLRFIVSRCEAMSNFCNKLWNASRFVLMKLNIDKIELPEQLETEDKWILDSLNTLIAEVTDNLNSYELGVAAQKLYDFVWDNFCDWYIELVKNRLDTGSDESRLAAQNVLAYVLIETLKLLHPFIPFITEEVWQALPHEGDALMVSSWPLYSKELCFPEEAAAMRSIMSLVRAVRNRRSEMNVPPSKKTHVYLVSENPDKYEKGRSFLERMTFASQLSILSKDRDDFSNMLCIVTDDARAYIPAGELVDVEKELERLSREIEKTEKELESTNKKLENSAFVQKAREDVVLKERQKAEKLRALLDNLIQTKNQLSS